METTPHTLNPTNHRGLGMSREDRVGVVATLQELHCRIRLGTLREFNIKLLDLMTESRRKERMGTNETDPIVCPRPRPPPPLAAVLCPQIKRT